MIRRTLSLLSALLVLFLPLSFSAADGYASWDPNLQAYVYAEPHYGIVICTRMNVRNKASTSGTSYGQIRNGQPVKILGTSQNGDFYLLDLESCGFTGVQPGAGGYAKTSLIKMDPEFIATTKLTNLYATPWTQELKNGEQSNRFFLMIAQYNSWYAVQAMESSTGTAFIRAGEIGQYTPAYRSMYVITWDTTMYDEYSWAPTQTIKRFTPGSLLSTSGDYTLLAFNEGTASEYHGWIPNQFIAPIIN